MKRRGVFALALFVGLLLLCAGELRAQCSFTGATHVTWPSVNPVWDFCFRRPSLSSAGNGAGLELSEVKYNGTLVIFQAHIPILNVKYVANIMPAMNGCGGTNLCYRDWFDSEQAFECAPTVAAGICSGTTTPAKTVCDACTDGTGLECRDVGSFNGVAVESLADRLKLTAQTQAGWYRYIPVWEFFADGTIQAKFVATSVDHTCVAYTHDHHAYYRFDLDVGGNASNYVDQVLSGGSTVRVTTERNFVDTSPARSKWRVGSPTSPYVVEIARNAGDGATGDPLPIPNDFPVADGWVFAYNMNEISDYTNTSSGCAVNIDPWDNNQNVDGADIVLWVRAGSLHEGEGSNQSAHCAMAGPTIRVLPTSTPSGSRFNTVAPCRVLDTRNPAGPYGAPPLAPAVPRSFVLQGQCGIPVTAKSVAVNLTVVTPSSTGNLIAYPTGGALPGTSVLNFSSGQTRANNAVLGLSAGGAVTLQSNVPSGNTEVVLDVTGWFE